MSGLEFWSCLDGIWKKAMDWKVSFLDPLNDKSTNYAHSYGPKRPYASITKNLITVSDVPSDALVVFVCVSILLCCAVLCVFCLFVCLYLFSSLSSQIVTVLPLTVCMCWEGVSLPNPNLISCNSSYCAVSLKWTPCFCQLFLANTLMLITDFP